MTNSRHEKISLHSSHLLAENPECEKLEVKIPVTGKITLFFPPPSGKPRKEGLE